MSKATIREVEAIAETDKALLCTDHGGWEQWVPKSQIHDDSEVYKKGQEGDLIVKSWWAEQNGIELD